MDEVFSSGGYSHFGRGSKTHLLGVLAFATESEAGMIDHLGMMHVQQAGTGAGLNIAPHPIRTATGVEDKLGLGAPEDLFIHIREGLFHLFAQL